MTNSGGIIFSSVGMKSGMSNFPWRLIDIFRLGPDIGRVIESVPPAEPQA
jgi:hypothetical protein